ncbi:MAG: hypothetical protein GY724_03745 [Actinomycetia bacterium]|nr:hypothetical protein [Actinomycetes bacterium]MCP5034432.1 hypothetical protein [Actinomycetes bacterium]
MSMPLQRPSFEELLDWIEGRLDPSDAAAMKARVDAADEETQRAVAWIECFLDRSRAMPLPAPPPIVRQRLRQVFKSHFESRSSVETIIVDLVFDSREGRELVGVRGPASTDDQFHLGFECADGYIMLDVARTGGEEMDIEGQVLLAGVGPPVFEAVARHGARDRSSALGDTFGRFALTAVPASISSLELSNGEMVLVVPLDLDSGGQ